jgi:hypothetical protein
LPIANQLTSATSTLAGGTAFPDALENSASMSNVSRPAVVLLALAVYRVAVGNEIHVTLHQQSDAKCKSTQVVVISESGERHEWSAPTPGSLTVDVPLNTFWTFTAAAENCWSKPVRLSPGIAVSDLTIGLWPITALRARVGFDGAPSHVTVAVRITGDPDPEYFPTQCRSAADLICDVPATFIDARISADGYGAKYVWNVNIPAGDGKLDPIVLRPGSTVIGRVFVKARERAAATGISVLLKAVDVDPPRTIKATKTAAAEWFQFTAVPAGSYVLVASKDGYAPAETHVVLSEPRNVELSSLVLERLLSFTVTISPPADPSGAPWHVMLQHRAEGSRYLRRVAASEADVTGRWDAKHIAPGTYIVSVVDASNNTFHAEELNISEGRSDAFVSVSLVNVVGSLSRSGKGVRAQLRFNGRDRTNVVLNSGDDGNFTGALPRDGKWWVDISRSGSTSVKRLGPIDVRRDETGSAKVDLRLSEGSLHGIVVDEDGKPADGAVFLQRSGKRLLETEIASDTGRFSFDDLETGSATIEARSSKGETGPVQVEVTKTGDNDVKLVVLERATISGWVTTDTAYPITGAYIRAIGSTFNDRRQVSTGPAGEFTLKVPRGTSAVTIVVLPYEGPVFLRRLAVSSSRQRIVAPRLGGKLLLRGGEGWPFLVGQDNDPVSILELTYPRGLGPPKELTDDGVVIELEPGAYSVCAPPSAGGRCVPANIRAGESTMLDLRAKP